MRRKLTELGLDATRLVVRGDDAAVARRVEQEELGKVVLLLSRLEELVNIIHRRGIDFENLLTQRRGGHLPKFHLVIDGRDFFAADSVERDEVLRKNRLTVDEAQTDKANGDGKADANLRRLQKNQELHETRELEGIFAALAEHDICIDDYARAQEESVSGEKLPTRYALVNEEKTIDVAGVRELLPQVLALGKSDIVIQRFKGLGEMNSEQLWDTTLDPSKRVLLRITLEEAGEAERLFSVLMGEDVERRRQFIEDHALEVKNLDV
jgi:DNA gyrase subunit B